ncbi:GNAT family N-acetyltransferase [Phyllobacterium leguminum]|uniref:GNAT family N-acetyltransferase n=1 Tax=Phyllobacterium leguminum TaxID=314237 RepID=UPI001FE1B2BA|nr:N-acetyltransferase [Phyllobacterium leguminum]
MSHFTAARFGQLLSRQNEHILVAQDTVGIVGFVHISSGAKSPVENCSDLEIVTLYVQSRHQHNGVGQRLLEAALRHCASSGRPNVWLTVNAENERAIGFYLKNGFERVGETQFQIGDQAYPNHVLRFRFR